jgi:hypothetical protein
MSDGSSHASTNATRPMTGVELQQIEPGDRCMIRILNKLRKHWETRLNHPGSGKHDETGIKLEWLAAWFHGLSGVVLEPPAGVNLPIATKMLELKPALEYVGKETLVSEDGSTRCGYRFNVTMSIDQDMGGAVVPRVYRGTIFLPERQETGEEWRRKASHHVEGTDTDHETLVSSIESFCEPYCQTRQYSHCS